jgi:hypothetical protein
MMESADASWRSVAIRWMAWSGSPSRSKAAVADVTAAAMQQPPCAPARQTQGQGGRGRGGRGGAATTAATVGSQILGQVAGAGPEVCSSFDGKWDAFIENYNVFSDLRALLRHKKPARRQVAGAAGTTLALQPSR